MDTWIIGVAGLASCALGAALVASVEIALVGLPAGSAIEAVAARRPGSRALAAALEDPESVYGTLHLVRIFFLLTFGVSLLLVATDLSWHLSEVALAGIATLALWIPVHLLPRMLAKEHALAWARWTIIPVSLLARGLWPVLTPAKWISRAVSRLLGGADSAVWAPGELADAAKRVHAAGTGQPDAALLDSIIEFSDTVIREIMVPRTDMSAIPVTASPEDVATAVVERGHSRVPVYEETIDNILGLLHVKDLFRAMSAAEDREGSAGGTIAIEIRTLVRPTFYVPEVMKISELLREFQRRKTHMAIVIDEYGGTAGVVTLEDIIEEIVGEIQDEYDVEEKQFRVLPDEKIIADGRVQVSDLEEILSVHFPDDTGFETLAGFLMFEAGYLPAPGAMVEWNGLCFTVKEGNEKRIATVEIERRRRRLEGGDGRSA